MRGHKRMLESWESITKVLCILLFLAMMTAKCYEQVTDHDRTTTTTRLVNLVEIPFPLDMDISLNPGFNQTELWELGYASSRTYFWGASRFNKSIFGWGGHTESGEHIGNPKDIFERVQSSRELNESVSVFAYSRDGDQQLSPSFSGLDRPFAPDNRLTLRINNIPEGAYIILISFKNIQNQTVTLSLKDQSLACNRPIGAFQGSRQGDLVKTEPFERATYIIDVNQNMFEEEDEEKNCVNYPTLHFDSYMDCDDAFVLDSVSRMGIGNQIPIWVTRNLSESNRGFFVENVAEYFAMSGYLWRGIELSNCPKPCTTTSTVSRLIERGRTEANHTEIWLQFSPKVQITVTELDSFPVLSYLSLTFANLGFLLGVNLPKILDCLSNSLTKWTSHN